MSSLSPERKLLGWFPMPSRSAPVQRRYAVLEENNKSEFISHFVNAYSELKGSAHRFTSTPSALLHVLLGERENLPEGFPHVAEHTDGQGKALPPLPDVTLHPRWFNQMYLCSFLLTRDSVIKIPPWAPAALWLYPLSQHLSYQSRVHI